MFHSIVHGFSCVKLADYIKPFQGTKLRKFHLDYKCYVSTIQPISTSRNFDLASRCSLFNSFFYRSHLQWNKLPISLREIIRLNEFNIKLLDYIWKNSINEDEYDKSLEGIVDESTPFMSNTEYSFD